MADTHDGGHDHHGPNFQAYMVVAVALSVFTVTSFVVNYFVRTGHLTSTIGFLLILRAAVVKTCLVGTYFMHLIVDWRKLYYLLIPAFILGTMMMFVLLPDIVIAWRY